MKTSCSVIQDLLPLYAEDLAGEDSRRLVEEHLAACESCRKTLEELKEVKPMTALTDAMPLQLVRQLLRKHTVAWCVLVGCLVAAIAFAVMGRLTEAEGAAYVKGVFAFEINDGGYMTVTVTDKSPDGVDYDIHYFQDELGRECMAISPYTSPLLRTLRLNRSGMVFTARSDTIRHVYYCDQTRGGSLTLLSGHLFPGPTSGGGAVLPRLVLNYYLFAALFLTGLFGVLWLIFRKRSPGSTLLAVALMFSCYALAHFAVKGLDGTTYFLLQDLAFILLTAAALWGAAMAFVTLRKLRHQW